VPWFDTRPSAPARHIILGLVPPKHGLKTLVQQIELGPGSFLAAEAPRRGWQFLLGFSFTLFVAGGLYFGWLFLHNWKVLASRQVPVQVGLPGNRHIMSIPVPAAPSIPKVPAVAQPGEDSTLQESTQPSLPLLPDWTDPNRINILLLGIDHRDDEPIDGSRSDTVMIVSIDPPSKSVVMVSLPRDLWVGIPGYGEQRINVAHSLGGPDLVMRTVTSNFGVRLNHYARIDFRGFEQIVNTIGGIFIDVERPVKDDEYPTEDYGVMRLYIPPGPQYMDGSLALQYARSRHGENDFGRARRQQRVLLAIRERAMAAGIIFKVGELIPLGQKTVSTDFGPLDIAKLAKLSMDLDREKIVNLVIDANYATPFTTNDGAQVLLPNRPAIQSAINQALTKAAAPPAQPAAARPPPSVATSAPDPTGAPITAPTASGPVRVEVLNGSGRAGLALQTGDWLKTRGYYITNIDTTARAGDTYLVAKPGREAAATVIATLLQLSADAVQVLPSGAGAPDVRIVIGQSFQPPR
jgi:polyisoprenyl-teichoic acid--peptidoglycan teichoic acid transferase